MAGAAEAKLDVLAKEAEFSASYPAGKVWTEPVAASNPPWPHNGYLFSDCVEARGDASWRKFICSWRVIVGRNREATLADACKLALIGSAQSPLLVQQRAITRTVVCGRSNPVKSPVEIALSKHFSDRTEEDHDMIDEAEQDQNRDFDPSDNADQETTADVLENIFAHRRWRHRYHCDRGGQKTPLVFTVCKGCGDHLVCITNSSDKHHGRDIGETVWCVFRFFLRHFESQLRAEVRSPDRCSLVIGHSLIKRLDTSWMNDLKIDMFRGL